MKFILRDLMGDLSMGYKMTTVITMLFFTSVCSAADKRDNLDSKKVNEQIEALEKIIIPPKGTEKLYVDIVYGVPKENEWQEGRMGKSGSSTLYPMHTYELLPPMKNQEFRAILYVTYKEGKVWYVGINHMCVIKNRIGLKKDLLEIQVENRGVLKDLIEIRERFKTQLDAAVWNIKKAK